MALVIRKGTCPVCGQPVKCANDGKVFTHYVSVAETREPCTGEGALILEHAEPFYPDDDFD